MMCAQSKPNDTYLSACSHNFPRSQRAEELQSWVFVTSNLDFPMLTKLVWIKC